MQAGPGLNGSSRPVYSPAIGGLTEGGALMYDLLLKGGNVIDPAQIGRTWRPVRRVGG